MERLSDAARRLLQENDEAIQAIAESESSTFDQSAFLTVLINKLRAASEPTLSMLRGPLGLMTNQDESLQDEIHNATVMAIAVVDSIESDPAQRPGELVAAESLLRQCMGVRSGFQVATLAAKRCRLGKPIPKLLFVLAEHIGKLQIESASVASRAVAERIAGLAHRARQQQSKESRKATLAAKSTLPIDQIVEEQATALQEGRLTRATLEGMPLDQRKRFGAGSAVIGKPMNQLTANKIMASVYEVQPDTIRKARRGARNRTTSDKGTT